MTHINIVNLKQEEKSIYRKDKASYIFTNLKNNEIYEIDGNYIYKTENYYIQLYMGHESCIMSMGVTFKDGQMLILCYKNTKDGVTHFKNKNCIYGSYKFIADEMFILGVHKGKLFTIKIKKILPQLADVLINTSEILKNMQFLLRSYNSSIDTSIYTNMFELLFEKVDLPPFDYTSVSINL